MQHAEEDSLFKLPKILPQKPVKKEMVIKTIPSFPKLKGESTKLYHHHKDEYGCTKLSCGYLPPIKRYDQEHSIVFKAFPDRFGKKKLGMDYRGKPIVYTDRDPYYRYAGNLALPPT